MSKKKKQTNTTWNNPSDELIFKKQLRLLRENKRRMVQDHELYYSEKQNQADIKDYYNSVIHLNLEGLPLFHRFHELMNKTHKNYIPYFMSKDLYLYT